MSNEETLWKARWKKTGRNFRVFVADDAKLQASAKNLEDAIEQLEERIAEERDDPVPNFEWINPLPRPLGLEGSDFVHIICGHRQIEVVNSEILFEKPRCVRCHNFSGIRTQELIGLSALPDDDFPFTQFGGQLCSAVLARFLKLSQNSELKLLPTVVAGIKSKECLELRTDVSREFVAKQGTPSRCAFRCQECQATLVAYLPDEADYFQFVAKNSLPHPIPPLFTIGSDYSLRIACCKELRRQIIGNSQFKNIRTRKVGILGEDLAVVADKFFAK